MINVCRVSAPIFSLLLFGFMQGALGSRTALGLASHEGYTELADMLIQAGAGVNLQDSWVRTGLILGV